jgi:hypothetical protein
MIQIKLTDQLVAEFTDGEHAALKGKQLKFTGKSKRWEVNPWSKFEYYCTIENVQERLDNLPEGLYADMVLEVNQ